MLFRSTIKINELREITDWEKPIYVKVGNHGGEKLKSRWRKR